MKEFKAGDKAAINKVYMSPYIHAPYENIPVTIIGKFLPNLYIVDCHTNIAGFTHQFDGVEYNTARIVPAKFLISQENSFKVDLI